MVMGSKDVFPDEFYTRVPVSQNYIIHSGNGDLII